MDFELEDLEDASRATRHAAIAGTISGGMTIVLALVAVAQGGALLNGLVDAWAFLDGAILLGLAYGTYRKSRASAVGLLGYYLLNQVLMRMEVGWSMGGGLVFTLLFTFFFVQGVRGAFLHHRLTHPEGETLDPL